MRVRAMVAAAFASVLAVGMAISGASAAFADSTEVTVGDYPHGVVVSPDGSRVYAVAAVPGGQPGRLIAVDTATDSVVGEAAVGVEPFGVTVSADGATIYVANINSSSISVIDAATLTVTATWPVAGGPFGITVDPTGSTVYTSLRNANSVAAVDATTGAVVTVFPTGGLPAGVALDSAAGLLYVAESGGSTVRRIDLAAGTSTALATFAGASPYFLELSPTGDEVWVSPYIGGDIAVIDTATFTVSSLIPVPGNARGIVFTDDGRAYVNLSDQSSVAVIDRSSNTVLGTTPVGNGPEALALAPDGLHAWSANLFGGSISLVGPAIVTGAADTTVVEGSQATFTATARATVDAVRWQSSTDNGTTWTDVPGATAVTLTIQATLADNGTLFRLVATSDLFGDEVVSEPATLTVSALPPTTTASGLAATGTDAGPALLLAVLGIAAGALALLGRRRGQVKS
ncbi:hypothetical protein WDJ51_13520 [Rathayibacter sp. YIM 133350]|uniref:YVTN family beta-propeller repeat protein n=1 Tax=Rathayibacter sp. YIM 133350 TaxID=3131992 RepID=UPI00307F3DED